MPAKIRIFYCQHLYIYPFWSVGSLGWSYDWQSRVGVWGGLVLFTWSTGGSSFMVVLASVQHGIDVLMFISGHVLEIKAAS
jgi:hypothetical protein